VNVVAALLNELKATVKESIQFFTGDLTKSNIESKLGCMFLLFLKRTQGFGVV